MPVDIEPSTPIEALESHTITIAALISVLERYGLDLGELNLQILRETAHFDQAVTSHRDALTSSRAALSSAPGSKKPEGNMDDQEVSGRPPKPKNPNGADKICASCKWFVPYPHGKSGECRGAPPTARLEQRQVSMLTREVAICAVHQWPPLDADDWCKEHESKVAIPGMV